MFLSITDFDSSVRRLTVWASKEGALSKNTLGKKKCKTYIANMATLPNVKARQDLPPKGGYPEVRDVSYTCIKEITSTS